MSIPRSRTLVAPYLGKTVEAALDGSLFAHVPATFRFRFADPEALWAELQDGYEDYLEDWDAGEVVPVAAVSAASAPDHEFAWLFLDWRDDEPRVVVTTTDRWSTGTGVASLADLGLVAT
ncbi:MAG: hypothetical protein H6708_17690 [Kofleriaceae bacterium]|nr:hypothetical protein [Myxococcales bacterium]MCB9562240.1 hypothetical protein [Kofleriaceae bacterium]